MAVQFSVTIPPEAIREAVRAELEALLPDLTARLLAATALQPSAPPPVAPPPVAPPPVAPEPAATFGLAAGPKPPVTIREKHLTGDVPIPCVRLHGFGFGHVPAGHRLRLRLADGTTLPVQTDDECRRPDGSLETAVLSYIVPPASAGTIRELTLDAVPGAQDRTPHTGPAEIAAKTRFVARTSGHSFGADIFQIDANAVLAANAGKLDDWGTNNPTTWVETVASGPIRQEYRVGGYMTRTRDGAMHGAVTADLYIRSWAGGAYEVVAAQWQPNQWAAHPAGKVGTLRQGYAGAFELFDGDARIATFGGPNHPQARTVPAAAFDPSKGTYTYPADQNLGQLDWAGGVSIGLKGGLPGGLAADGVYYACDVDGGKRTMRFTSARNDAGKRVSFTAAATGSVTVYPLFHSFPGSGAIGMDANGEPIWRAAKGGLWDGKARPRSLVGFDEAYLTRSTGLVGPMDLTLPRTAEPGTPAPYLAGQVQLAENWDLRYQGDNWNHDRIGPLHRQASNLVLTPFDEVRTATCRRLGLMQADFPWNWRDERCGRQSDITNGADGAARAKLASPVPGLFMHSKQDGPLPAFGALRDWWNNGNGYTIPYNQMNDGSHQPNYVQMPYMTTGHRVYRDMLRNMVFCCWASQDPYYIRQRTFNGRKYYGIFDGQERSVGWHTMAASLLRMVLPGTDPEREVLESLWDDHVSFTAEIAKASPGSHLGLFKVFPVEGAEHWADWTDWGGRQFQHIYKATGFVFALYRGEERLRGAVECLKRFMADQFDDGRSGCSGFGAGRYDQEFGPQGNQPGGLFASLAEMSQRNAGGPGPYPERGLRDFDGKSPFWAWGDPAADPDPKDFATAYIVQHCAVLALMDQSGLPGCAAVRQRLMDRTLAQPGGAKGRSRFPLSRADKPDQMAVQWSFLPRGV